MTEWEHWLSETEENKPPLPGSPAYQKSIPKRGAPGGSFLANNINSMWEKNKKPDAEIKDPVLKAILEMGS